MNTKKTPEDILRQIASIRRMEKGTLSTLRQTAGGRTCNFQRWEDGRNRSEYIPANGVAAVEVNLETYAEFEKLADSYVQAISARSREERLSGDKKKRRAPTSPSRRKPRSKA